MSLCGLINGLIGLVATAVFRDIVAPTMKIELVPGWVGGGLEGRWRTEEGVVPTQRENRNLGGGSRDDG